jgi:hypothetical protein
MSKLESQNRQAYDKLQELNLMWDRRDANHIVVVTSGYKTEAYYLVSEMLASHKMVQVQAEYDKIGGCTHAVYRHK